MLMSFWPSAMFLFCGLMYAVKSALKVNVLISPKYHKNKIININCNNVPGVLAACSVNSMLMNDQAALQWRAHGCSNAR